MTVLDCAKPDCRSDTELFDGGLRAKPPIPQANPRYCIKMDVVPRLALKISQPLYSTIVSASSKGDCEILISRAFTVFRLRAISNLVGCSIGKSDVLAPIAIMWT